MPPSHAASDTHLACRVVVHDDGDHTDARQEAHRSTHDVLVVQPVLALGIQANVVHVVVVCITWESKFRLIITG